MGKKRKYCEKCKKELLIDSKICPICSSKLIKARQYCLNCEKDIVIEGDLCPTCGSKTHDFMKIRSRIKCLDCLEEFCSDGSGTCPGCKSRNFEELECPCVFYPKECVKLY